MRTMIQDTAEDLDVDPLWPEQAPVESAATDGENLYYDPGFLRDIEYDAGPDAARFVVGHELAHGRDTEPSQHNELDADRASARSLARDDGDIDAIMTVFGHLAPSDDDHHPARPVRERAARRAFRDERDEMNE
jgi:hypothetical protein